MTPNEQKKKDRLEQQIRDRFDENARMGSDHQGRLEEMQDRISKLEGAVAHLISWLIVKGEVQEQDLDKEYSITDF